MTNVCSLVSQPIFTMSAQQSQLKDLNETDFSAFLKNYRGNTVSELWNTSLLKNACVFPWRPFGSFACVVINARQRCRNLEGVSTKRVCMSQGRDRSVVRTGLGYGETTCHQSKQTPLYNMTEDRTPCCPVT